MTEIFKQDENILKLAQAYSLDAVDYGKEASMSLDWSDKSVKRTEDILANLHEQIKQAQPSEDQIYTFAKMF